MSGRPRTSTLVISGLFLAVLALYILVRPVTPPTSAGTTQSARTLPRPHRRAHVHLTPADPVTSPVAHSEPLGHAGQHLAGAPRVTHHGAAHPRHVAVRRVADPVTSSPGVRPAGRSGRSPTG